jgi:hypothetical protein
MSVSFEAGSLLRIFVGEADSVHGVPFHQAVLDAAREHNIAGVTVVRGIESYGAHKTTHTARILRLSDDLPLVIEIADTPEKIDEFAMVIESLFDNGGVGGAMTVSPIQIKRFTETG